MDEKATDEEAEKARFDPQQVADDRTILGELDELIANVRAYKEAAEETGAHHIEKCRPGSAVLGGWLLRLDTIRKWAQVRR